MKKLVLATILAGTALFGGMTANAAEIQVAKAFSDSHEIIAKDVMPDAFKSGPKFDGPKMGRDDKGPGRGEKRGREHRYGPKHPNESSGAKNYPGGPGGPGGHDKKGPGGRNEKRDNKGPGGPGNAQAPKALAAFTVQQSEFGQCTLPKDISFGLFGHSHRYDPPPPPPGDWHEPPPPPPPPDRGPRIDGRYGPRHPNSSSGAKYGPRDYNE